jgi:Helix-turn-helix domain
MDALVKTVLAADKAKQRKLAALLATTALPRRAIAKDDVDDDPLLPALTVARMCGVVRRTLSRWVADPELGFPAPVLIRDRWYFRRSEIEAFRATRARRTTQREAEVR